MANPTWPATLPQVLLRGGYSEQPPDNSIRTKMDSGPDKTRRVSTAVPRPVKGQRTMTEAQVETLDVFYVTTLADGNLRFDWVQPRTQIVETLRFVSRPTYAARADGRWNVALDLEIMP